MRIARLLKRWYSLQGKVGRQEYLLTGVGLMVLKYAVEAAMISHFTGKFYSPLDFINPFLAARAHFTEDAPGWLGVAWVIWTIPFVWIAVTMTMRRAIDAGASPWAAMLVLVPIVNLLAMVFMACIPTDLGRRKYSHGPADVSGHDHVPDAHGANAAFVGIAVGFVYMLLSVGLLVVTLNNYGAAFFYGTPLVSGAATAYTYNRRYPRPLGMTIGLSILTGFCFASALLLIGLEGFICIAMAAPIIIPLGLLGALIGRAIAVRQQEEQTTRDAGLIGCLLILPLLGSVETYFAAETEFEVVSSVEINAPPERVWQCVIDFPEITERPEWLFRLGIACPERARIDGEGVGAVRHCEFTTGDFVEPITVWDPPRRLAFDVTDQPDPMFELSPYRHLHPPHLDGGFRSTRGEFCLVPLPDGRTRLEGSTWYQLKIYPHSYWTLWTDWLVHRIHLRVLRHIERLAEAD